MLDVPDEPSSSAMSLVKAILLGQYELVTHQGISQYGVQGKGASACGIIALNFVRVALQKRQSIGADDVLIADITSRETAEVCHLLMDVSITAEDLSMLRKLSRFLICGWSSHILKSKQ